MAAFFEAFYDFSYVEAQTCMFWKAFVEVIIEVEINFFLEIL